jgi:predicted RecB family nuclease
MLRYATREEEVDRLLRGEVFIDLHSITKQSVRASVEQYSLKEMERFCDYRRRVPLPIGASLATRYNFTKHF